MLTYVLHTGVEVADLAKTVALYEGLGCEIATQKL